MIEIKYIRRLFWTAFWFTLMIMLFMGCATQKRCFELYPPEILSDTITRIEVEYRDTIVEVLLPGDTVREEIAVVIPCPEEGDSVVLDPSPDLTTDTVAVTGTLADARAWIEAVDYKSVRLHVRLIEHEHILKIKLDSVIKIKDHFRELYTVEIHKEPPIIKVPWYYRASLPVAVVLLLLLFAILMFKR